MFLQSELLKKIPGVIHGFGTREEAIPSPFQANWETARPKWKQVHGASIAQVHAPGDPCGDVDALYSRKSGIPISVMTADCVPVLLARRDGSAVAAVHAGWKGTQARILNALFTRLESEGESPGDWIAAVGPAIGPCCYEVSTELANQFERDFSYLGPELAVPSHRHLDLPAINAAELKQLGVAEVDLLRACTRCTLAPDQNFQFQSYRREGSGTRQYSVLQIL